MSCHGKTKTSLDQWEKMHDRGGWPFPFQKRDQHWLDNRKQVQAKMRLEGLRKMFMKNENFFKDYSNFMEDLFQKGYAERSPNILDGNKWYIPHHWIHHPAKLGKIRVMFDCSVEYLGYD